MLFRDSTFVASKPAVTIVSPVLTENVIRCESLWNQRPTRRGK